MRIMLFFHSLFLEERCVGRKWNENMGRRSFISRNFLCLVVNSCLLRSFSSIYLIEFLWIQESRECIEIILLCTVISLIDSSVFCDDSRWKAKICLMKFHQIQLVLHKLYTKKTWLKIQYLNVYSGVVRVQKCFAVLPLTCNANYELVETRCSRIKTE